MIRIPKAPSILRGLLQTLLCIALIFLAAMDYKALQYIKYGPDVIHFDNAGCVLAKPALSQSDYTFFAALFFVQLLLIVSLYRLRGHRA